MRISISLLIILLTTACSRPPINYESFKKAQDYNVPLWKDDIIQDKKKALFIFPHPDDEIVCGGTIAILKQQGWEVDLLTLTQGESTEKETRKKEWVDATKSIGIDKSQLLDMPNNTWENIMNDKLIFWKENADSVKQIILKAILEYSPSLLFTYDDVLGGYGHPEHRITAAIVKEIFLQYKNDSSFSPKSVYQLTLPEKLESMIIGKLESYKKDVAVNAGKNLPEPSISFDIKGFWQAKRNAALLYPSQEKTLKKFFILPAVTDTAAHYSAFDREYYFVISR